MTAQRPLRGPQQNLVERLEPVAQRLETVTTNRIDNGLQRLVLSWAIIGGQLIAQVHQRLTLQIGRRAIDLLGGYEILVIAHRIACGGI